VSVHATPWEARKQLLNNPRVPNIKAQLERLVEGGIQFHGQMVVVPGLNDGDVLEESLSDLYAFGDACLSVALVPVGLTQFSHIYTGASMDVANASRILDAAERWSARAKQERGEVWVYGSDELYLLAGRPLPSAEHYGDYSQIENGVGAVTSLRDRVRDGLDRLPRLAGKRIGVVTGSAMAALMPDLLDQLAVATGAKFQLIPTVNSLFGPTVTTAGLLVGADITGALAGRTDLDLALIPAETINEAGVFLDDLSFVAVRESLPMPVYPSYDFIDVLEQEGASSYSLAGSSTDA
jgi:NifB/MoaA-like Fe-S oxidoreductase